MKKELMTGLTAICLTGCASPRAHFYMGQGLDTLTTYQALEVEEGFEESNPLADNFGEVILMKLGYIGLTELMVKLDPKHKDTYYKIGAFFGYAAGAANIYTMEFLENE